MSNSFASFLQRLDQEHAGEFVISVRPYSCEEDRSITHFVNILMVPRGRLHNVAWRAWEIAEEVYGNEPTTFLMTTVSPESSAEHFAAQLEAAGRGCVRAPVKVPSGRIQVRRRIDVHGLRRASVWRRVLADQESLGSQSKLPTPEWSIEGGRHAKSPTIGHAWSAARTVEPHDPIHHRYPFAA
jgi:hypothetical protein